MEADAEDAPEAAVAGSNNGVTVLDEDGGGGAGKLGEHSGRQCAE